MDLPYIACELQPHLPANEFINVHVFLEQVFDEQSVSIYQLVHLATFAFVPVDFEEVGLSHLLVPQRHEHVAVEGQSTNIVVDVSVEFVSHQQGARVGVHILLERQQAEYGGSLVLAGSILFNSLIALARLVFPSEVERAFGWLESIEDAKLRHHCLVARYNVELALVLQRQFEVPNLVESDNAVFA